MPEPSSPERASTGLGGSRVFVAWQLAVAPLVLITRFTDLLWLIPLVTAIAVVNSTRVGELRVACALGLVRFKGFGWNGVTEVRLVPSWPGNVIDLSSPGRKRRMLGVRRFRADALADLASNIIPGPVLQNAVVVVPKSWSGPGVDRLEAMTNKNLERY